MNQLTLSECSKRKLDETYLVVYAIKNEINIRCIPSESAVYKILFLRIRELSEKWNKPIKNWKTIREQLISLFGDRFLKYIKL